MSLADWSLKGNDGKPYAPSAVCWEHDQPAIRKHIESRVLLSAVDWEPPQWVDCYDEDIDCVLCAEETA